MNSTPFSSPLHLGTPNISDKHCVKMYNGSIAKVTVQKILNVFGYELRKRENVACHHTGHGMLERKALIIEFVGPSGIGKSTLFRKLLSRRRMEAWMSTAEWLKNNGVKLSAIELDAASYQIMKKKYEAVLARDCSFIDKIRLNHFFLGNLREDIALRAQGPAECVIRNDGVFHNFARELTELWGVSKEEFRGWTAGRAFVFMYASGRVHRERIIQRQLAGKTRPQHKLKTPEQLDEINKEAVAAKRELLDAIMDVDGTYMELNLTEGIEQQCAMLENYVSMLVEKWDAESGRWIDA